MNTVAVPQVSMKTRIPNVQSLVWESYVIIDQIALIPSRPVAQEYVRTDVLFVTMIPTAAVQAKFVVKVVVRNLV